VPTLGAALLLGVGVWTWASSRTHCDDGSLRLAGIWDDARRQEVKDALLATGLPYAAHTWERVEPRLDDHAQAWVERHAAACEAATAGTEAADVELSLACLARSRDELREAVEVLAHANSTVVSNALALVDALPEPARCDDVATLRATLFEPADPRVAGEVAALRERLSRARSLERAGEYDAGLSEADAVVAAAEPLDHRPLVAEALLVRGQLRELAGRYAEAQQDLERAYFLAVELGAREVEQAAASLLVRVTALQQARYDLGRHWGRTALAVARREPVDPAAEARALAHVGTALWKEGELDQAIEHHQRAMELAVGVLGSEHPLVVDSLNSLGVVALTQGKLDEALAYQQRALALAEAVLGPGVVLCYVACFRHPGRLHTPVIIQRRCRNGVDTVAHQRHLDLRSLADGSIHCRHAGAKANRGVISWKRRRDLEAAYETLRGANTLVVRARQGDTCATDVNSVHKHVDARNTMWDVGHPTPALPPTAHRVDVAQSGHRGRRTTRDRGHRNHPRVFVRRWRAETRIGLLCWPEDHRCRQGDELARMSREVDNGGKTDLGRFRMHRVGGRHVWSLHRRWSDCCRHPVDLDQDGTNVAVPMCGPSAHSNLGPGQGLFRLRRVKAGFETLAEVLARALRRLLSLGHLTNLTKRDGALLRGHFSGRRRGNRMVSRIDAPVSSMSSRSTPMPIPPAGGMPYSIALRNASSRSIASGSPLAASSDCSTSRSR
jgi:tetratricopeptide (TPR) repeat protein